MSSPVKRRLLNCVINEMTNFSNVVLFLRRFKCRLLCNDDFLNVVFYKMTTFEIMPVMKETLTSIVKIVLEVDTK